MLSTSLKLTFIAQNMEEQIDMAPIFAGFWKRAAAFLLDTIILYILMIPIALALGVGLGAADVEISETSAKKFADISIWANIILAWIYVAAMESSSKQATLGKMALGIKVTDIEGRRIGFFRATFRHFAKYLSALILFIGFIMVAFTEKKQGLHDMLTGCLVLEK